MSVKELAAKTADALEEHGWTNGFGQDENGCLCILGAIQLALGNNPHSWTTADDFGEDGWRDLVGLHNALGVPISDLRTAAWPELTDLWHWNDKVVPLLTDNPKRYLVNRLRDVAASA